MTAPDLPKIDLHLHLEGAAPPAFVRDRARARHIDIGGLFDEAGGYRIDGFAQALQVRDAVAGVLGTPEDYHALTLEVLHRSADDGVIYTEAFLSPDFCGGRSVIAFREYVAAIAEAAAQAEAERGIVMRGIVTCFRHLGPQRARQTALCAAEAADGFVRGFGIAGDETMLHPRDFAWPFDAAREAGLRLTAHAGERRGPEGIRDTLAALRPDRIGHGVRAVEDPALVDELAGRGIVLEVCPGANLALGLYPDCAAHPVGRLRDRGVKVAIGTDDPSFLGTSMVREYDRLAQAFGWDEGAFRAIAAASLDAAFCDAKTRARVADRLEPAHA